MKHLFSLIAGLALLGALAGCPATMSTGNTAQDALNASVTACKNIDAAIVTTDQAVLSGLLKGNDARNALKGLTAAQAGCVTTLGAYKAASAAASAASGAKP